ncbi:hypothetical protein KW783_00230 [Candidatus Parcubacteria bacterium]|nr:hypothetical protein [Candidatus Parcubacteria bacterium]
MKMGRRNFGWIQMLRPTCTPESSNFRCEYVSQGILFDPDNPPPKVCGCRPAFCPNGQHIIVGTAQGMWPDGSQKGTFGCTSEDVP